MNEEDLNFEEPIKKQWDIWIKKADLENVPDISDEELREAVLKDLDFVNEMSVEEYTLFRKWREVQDRYPHRVVKTLWGKEKQLINPEQIDVIKRVKNSLWYPKDVDDYLNLEPELIFTDNTRDDWTTLKSPDDWNTLRTFASTMRNNSNIGRNLNYLIKDKNTGTFLGIICISSDFLDLTPRDNYIGWSREKKTQGRMINHTAIGSTIVPIQPLGFNYVGGKLLALLCLSDEIQKRWKELYGDVLVGVTTTSLYGKNKAGGLSQYDGLKHWKKMGFTEGSVSYETTKSTIKMMLDWLKKKYTRQYFLWYEAKNANGQPYKRDHRNRSYTFVYTKLGIPKDKVRSDHQRGIYFSPFYTNTSEFLRGEIKENELVKLFDTSTEYLVDLWKNKYARKRIESLKKDNRVSSEVLFYDDLIYLSWPETKEKYLSAVGR